MSTLSLRLSLALPEGTDPDLYLEDLERDDLLGEALLGLGNPGYLGVQLELPLSWDAFAMAHQVLERLQQTFPGATLVDAQVKAHPEEAPAEEDEVPGVVSRKLSDETIQAMVDSMRIPRP